MSFNFFKAAGDNLNSSQSGASQGAAAGPWGALIGGIAGGVNDIVGQVGNYFTQKKMDGVNKSYSENTKKALEEWLAGKKKLTEEEATALLEEVKNADYEAAGKVDFDKDSYNLDDYYAKNREQILASAGRTAQSSAAGAGMGRSTGAALGIASAVASKDESLTRDAQSAMEKAMDTDYKIASDEASNRLQALKQKIATNKELLAADEEAEDMYQEALQGLRNQNYQYKMNKTQAGY